MVRSVSSWLPTSMAITTFAPIDLATSAGKEAALVTTRDRYAESQVGAELGEWRQSLPGRTQEPGAAEGAAECTELSNR